MMSIDEFKIAISDAALDDLYRRLDAVRWTDEIGGGWDYGADLSFMKSLVEYWRHTYDWRAQEAALNKLPSFKTSIDGHGLHFIHARGKGPHCLPLLLSHGWPGSFVEFVKLIPRLTDPASHGGDNRDAFDVIIPSLPGFGFSDRPTTPGMHAALMGKILAGLMAKLGYVRYALQGGDWGSAVSTAVALAAPRHVVGVHLNYIAGRFLLDGSINDDYPEQEVQAYVKRLRQWWDVEGGYTHQQTTKPQTLACGLNDSPAGLAAWIIDKFRAWSDCKGEIERVFTRDELITNVMIYWLTETIGSSARIYYETRRSPLKFNAKNFVTAPVAVALFPAESPMPPRFLAERGMNITRWTEMPAGGHFAAMEQPELLTEDIRYFFRPLR